MVLDEDAERIEVVVPDDQLSLAIGRRGQNVRLASQLTGWDIDILTEAEESRAPPEGIRRAHRALHERARRRRGGRPAARLRRLPHRSRSSPMSMLAELASIEGFDEDTAAEIQAPRAATTSPRIEAEHDAARQELGVEDELKEVDGVTTAMLVALGENDVKTVEDLAGCATDDLVGWTERKDGEATRDAGYLDGFDLSRDGSRGHDHGRPRQGRLGRGSGRGREIGRGRRGSVRSRRVLTGHGNAGTNDLARHEPERTCIVTRAALPAAGLIRFVLGPDDRVFADLKHKLPGRGVWVTARRDVVQEAVKRRLFARAFKAEVKVPDTLRGRHRGLAAGRSAAGLVARQ